MNPWILLAAAQEGGNNAAADEWSQQALALFSVGLLVIAVLLFIVEFFIISGGVIAALSGVCTVVAIMIAFRVHPGMGLAMIAATPVIGVVTLRWGLRRLNASPLVTQTAIQSDAGYHHLAEQLGIAVGSDGEMVTAAMPTGRCRFAGGEADVVIEGGSAQRGDRVRVQRINGPTITVAQDHPNNPTNAE